MSTENLPLKEIPGSYGLPLFGPIRDRFDFFYKQGQDEFFRARVKKYNSTVFRANVRPGPFNAKDSKVVVLLDAVSFPVLFDVSKVEKRDVFSGTFMPSTHFTGGYRVCSYLDPSEPKHAILKSFFLSFLSRAHKSLIPTFRSSVGQMFVDLEEELAVKGQAGFNAVSDKMAFDFLFRLFGDGKSSYETSVGGGGNGNLDKWLLFQLAPLVTLGLKWLPNFVEDFVLHTFPLPFWAVKSGYEKVHNAFRDAAAALLDEAAESMAPGGISKDEATHNLLFLTGFNAYGGMKVLFPALMKYVGAAGEDLHRRLAAEIRAAVKEEGGKVTLAAVNKMSLTKSVAWEAMRIEPPVAYQFGRAKHDITVASHTAAFVIEKGEMICGYQPFATKDPEIFESPEDFVADRFVGEEGEKMIKYVVWSNGREDEEPTAANKQCPAKDMVVLLARMMVVDTFTVESGTILLGTSVTFKSLTNATW